MCGHLEACKSTRDDFGKAVCLDEDRRDETLLDNPFTKVFEGVSAWAASMGIWKNYVQSHMADFFEYNKYEL